MDVRGIHYDIGTTTLDGPSTRPSLTADEIERETSVIARDLHANAIRISGGDIRRLALAARAAAIRGLDVWLSPMSPNADPATTMALVLEAAEVAEDLRRAGHPVVLVVGCELSAFMAGIVPGETAADRIGLLGDMTRLVAEVTASGIDPQERFAAFLGQATANARARFRGPLTYASGTWEQVDWSAFDIVGVDAYRDIHNRDSYTADLRALAAHGRPVVVTELGCATYRGAADSGSLAWTAVDRTSEPRRLRAGFVRDEAGQARELTELIDSVEVAGLAGAFIYTYVAPSYPASADPAFDLDVASYALVRSWPDGRTEPKRAFHAVAEAYAGRAAGRAESGQTAERGA